MASLKSGSAEDLVLEAGNWRPLPSPTWLSQPFWDSCADERLIVQQCGDCGSHVFRPQFACTSCFSTNLDWVQASGSGFLHSYSIVRRPAYPELPEVYVVAAVRMTENWFMMSNLIDCRVEDVQFEMPLEVVYRSYGDLTLPFVKPATA